MDGAEGGYRVQEINTFEEFKGLRGEGRPVDWRLAEGEEGSPQLRRRVDDLLATMRGVEYCGPEEMQWRGIDTRLEDEDLSLWVELIPSAGLATGSEAGLGPFVQTNFIRIHVGSHKPPRSAFAG